MICNDCKKEMENITEKFDSTEKHLLGPGWSHFLCLECGKGKHVKEENMATEQKLKILPGKELPAELEAKLMAIKEKQEQIDLQMEYTNSLYEDKKITKLISDKESIEKKIKTHASELGIPQSEALTGELMEELRVMVNEVGPEIPADFWGPDSFSKGKKDAISSKDGIIVLLRSKRTERRIVPKLFVEKYPIVTNEMVEKGKIKITLEAAEEKLGKKDIESVCEKDTTFGYELVIKDGRNLPNSG